MQGMLGRWFYCVVLLALPVSVLAQAAAPSPTYRWFNAQGHPDDPAAVAVDALVQADTQGLNPHDYHAAALQQAFQRLKAGVQPDAAQLQQLDEQLTLNVRRYLRDLHTGRLDPATLEHRFKPPVTPEFNPSAYLDAALQSGRLRQALQAAAPAIPLYQSVRQALLQYQQLQGHPAWKTPLSMPSGKRSVKPGEPYPLLAVLFDRLVALGDLALGTQVPPTYNGPIVDAVKAFQQRHGLEPDGVLGQATLAALNVTPAQRVQQISLTLERLRWTPLLHSQRMIVVNIPEFVLRAYEVRDGTIDMRLQMRVIVGKALNTRTPVFQEDMRYIEFSPYWNIPPSIARTETLPRLRSDPAYLDRQGMEFVTSSGQVVTAVTDQALQAVQAGQWRIRQRPGPQNALGDIKFIFPNNQNIYLHHTPAEQLFSRTRRDFSHGCIRVEEPVELAKFVLRDNPEWTEAAIRQAMHAGTSRTIRLDKPLPVLIAYSTVLVKNGKVFFFPDIYQQDSRLEHALAKVSDGALP
jgi:murein L,D-transpeptidase YcbB/YkuD